MFFLYSINTNIYHFRSIKYFLSLGTGSIFYPGTTSFRPPKKYFVSFYLLSSPIVLVIALYYLSVQEQQI